jgi:hypothetical protein
MENDVSISKVQIEMVSAAMAPIFFYNKEILFQANLNIRNTCLILPYGKLSISNVLAEHLKASAEERHIVSNGTMTFVRLEDNSLVAVTNAHVYKSYEENVDCVTCQILNLPFDLISRKIDINYKLDLATFRIYKEELKQIKLNTKALKIRKLDHSAEIGLKHYFAGFPSIEIRVWSNSIRDVELDCGIVAGGVSSLSLTDTNLNINLNEDRIYWRPVLGKKCIIPETYDYRGISGGPVVCFMNGVPYLVGIIYQGPGEHLERIEDETMEGETIGAKLIHSTRADFICADGSIRHDWPLAG